MKFTYTIATLILGMFMSYESSARDHVEPKSLKLGILEKSSIQLFELPATDIQASLQKNQYQSFQAKPLRFANPNFVSVTTESHGQWTDVPGGKIWQLRFVSENATDMNFGITEFNLPKGVELHFMSFADDPVYFDGPYTSKDNRSYEELWSAPLPGGDVAVELFIPEGINEKMLFKISQVSAGFRDVFKRDGGSGLSPPRQGACNNDVVCDVGDPWRDEIRSVAAYTINGTDTCTGTLIMDANRSFRPFFLTAYHCSVTAGNAAAVVTIWNYESLNCGDLSGGSRVQTVSGSTFLARRADVDMGLIELSETPSDEYNVYYAGWDRSGNVPSGSVGIHHPGVDEKAISFNTDPLTTVNNCIGGGGSNTHWEVNNWEDGTTEPGSSGSGIWDPVTRQVVGFLSGGTASCNSITSDCYGKFSEGWDNGGADSLNMKPWLDPDDTGLVAVDGSNASPFSLSVMDELIAVCTGDDAVYDLTIDLTDNLFSDPITLSTSTLPGATTAAFNNNPVMAPATSQLTISNTGGLSVGSYSFDLFADSGIESAQKPLEMVVSNTAPGTTTLQSPQQGATGVPTLSSFSWSDQIQATAYLIELSTDMNFSQVALSETTNDTSFTVTNSLNPNTQYYWRVTPLNGCGNGVVSQVFTFTTSNEICFIGNAAIPDDDSNGVTVPLDVTQIGTITDLDIKVVSNHTWPGDLIFTLSHVGSGTTTELMNRPGSPASNNGCSQDGIDVTFDDDSTIDVESSCSGSSPGIGGVLNPDGDLSLFNGQQVSGTWELFVSDNVGVDTGQINEFCLIPSVFVVDLIFEDGFEQIIPD